MHAFRCCKLEFVLACYFSLIVFFLLFLLLFAIAVCIICHCFFSLFLWVLMLIFCIYEHGHAILSFGVFFLLLLLAFSYVFLIFVNSFCLGSIGVKIKVGLSNPYCGFMANADSFGMHVWLKAEVCMGEFTCSLLHNLIILGFHVFI